MGDFRIEIDAIGNHGHARDICNGGSIKFGEHENCGNANCVDCAARDFVRRLQEMTGGMVKRAVLTHWPSQPTSSVYDDLLSGKRTGQF